MLAGDTPHPEVEPIPTLQGASVPYLHGNQSSIGMGPWGACMNIWQVFPIKNNHQCPPHPKLLPSFPSSPSATTIEEIE